MKATKENTEILDIPKTIRVAGSHAVMLSLINEGVDTIFGYPGGAIMPVYDSMMDYQDQIKHILTRHEQGAVHAAQGYARVSGRWEFVWQLLDLGATNLITGIADALIDSTPLVCITGQVICRTFGTDAFQETDVVGISMPVTKWNYLVTKSEEIPCHLAQAFLYCQDRQIRADLDIAKDGTVRELDFEYQRCYQYAHICLDTQN